MLNSLELKRLRTSKTVNGKVLSQYELAMETGLDPSDISRMEKGKSQFPDFKTVAALAEYFEVPEEQLLIAA